MGDIVVGSENEPQPSDRDAAFDSRVSWVMRSLREVGWVARGTAAYATQTLEGAFCLDSERCVVRPEVALNLLPIKDDGGNLYPGYSADADEEIGLTVGYEGLLNTRFELVTTAMKSLAKDV